MKKRYFALFAALALCVSFAIAQNGFLSGAYFVNPTVLGTIPMCNQFSGGLCVYSPSGLVDNGTILTYKGVQVGLITSGVTQITAGTGISVSNGGVGNVTVTNTSLNNAVSGAGTYTTATSDAVTVTGATSSSHCSFSPTNATAAAATVVGYISGVAANSVTITHVATSASGGTVNVVCTLN